MKNDLEELTTTTVEHLLKKLEPGPFETWDCSEEITERLNVLSPKTVVTCYGDYRFRLADDYPSYYVTQLVIK